MPRAQRAVTATWRLVVLLVVVAGIGMVLAHQFSARLNLCSPDDGKRVEAHLREVGLPTTMGEIPGGLPPAEKLMDEEVYPVCSPKLLREQQRLRTLADLANETLIHDLSMDSHADFPSWEAWLQKAGVADVATTRGMKINNSAAVLQAAAEGQGVALARSVMAHDDLTSGRLVRLFPELTFPSPLAYYAVYRTDCAGKPKLRAFRDWLIEEANRWLPPGCSRAD